MKCYRWLALLLAIGISIFLPQRGQSAAADDAVELDAGDLGLGLYCTVFDNEAETIEFIEKCQANGIATLFPSLSGPGNVYWKSDLEIQSDEFQKGLDAGYDSLASMISHAHAAGIIVYPSVAVGPATKLLEEHPEWETLDREGQLSSKTSARFLSFAYPEARANKVALLMELVNGYDIDGIMLDYCRYPETTREKKTAYGFYGYDPHFIQACLSIHGFDPREESIDSPKWNKFNQMRRDSVATFVRELREAVDQSGRKIRIGGFGDTNPSHELRMCGRDCPGWSREGLIDDYFLATYTEKIEDMPETVAQARDMAGPDVKIYSALTPFNHFLTTNDQMVAAGEAQLSGGADGLWVYRSDYLEESNLWDGAQAASRLLSQ